MKKFISYYTDKQYKGILDRADERKEPVAQILRDFADACLGFTDTPVVVPGKRAVEPVIEGLSDEDLRFRKRSSDAVYTPEQLAKIERQRQDKEEREAEAREKRAKRAELKEYCQTVNYFWRQFLESNDERNYPVLERMNTVAKIGLNTSGWWVYRHFVEVAEAAPRVPKQYPSHWRAELQVFWDLHPYLVAECPPEWENIATWENPYNPDGFTLQIRPGHVLPTTYTQRTRAGYLLTHQPLTPEQMVKAMEEEEAEEAAEAEEQRQILRDARQETIPV